MQSESPMAVYMCYICLLRVANLAEDAKKYKKSIKNGLQRWVTLHFIEGYQPY